MDIPAPGGKTPGDVYFNAEEGGTPMTFVTMLKTSLVMPVLLVLSIVVLAQAFERIWVFFFEEKMPGALWDSVRSRLEDGDEPGALTACMNAPGIAAEALARLLSLPPGGPEASLDAAELYRRRLELTLSRRLGLFGTASFIAPLIGLLGTVLGIMRAFHDLAAAGAGGPAVVAAGISEALVATAAGIGVAVVSAIFYNGFSLTLRRRLGVLDLWVLELSELRAGGGSAAPAPPPKSAKKA